MSQRGFRSFLLVCGLLGQLGAGCAPTETGNPPLGSVQLGLTAFSSAPKVAAVTEPQGGIVVDRLSVNVAALSLLPCAASSPPLDAAPGSYDTLDGSHSALTGDARLCGVRLDLAPSASAPNAIYVHGLRADGSEFEVVSTAARSLSLQAPAGASFGGKPLLLGFDVGVWFTNVDVHGAHAGPDGVARLDATLNPALLTTFEAQTSVSVALYQDENADGQLSATEAAAIATAP